MTPSPPAPPPRKAPNATLGFERAQALHRQGQFEAAEQLYRSVLELDPDHAGALHYLGLVLSQRGQADGVVAAIRRSLAIKPTPGAHNDLGLALGALGDAAGAAAEFQAALALDPNYVEAINNLGNLLRAHGQLEPALACFAEAVRLRPDVAELHANQAHVLAGLGRTDDAIATFRGAVAIKPALADARQGLAQALLAQDRRDEALAELRAALEAAPDNALTHHHLGTVLSAMDLLDEAIPHLQAAIRLQPDLAEAHNNLGNALAARERRDEALAAFQAAVALRPDFVEALSGVGHMLNALGRADEGEAPLLAALALDPDFPEAHHGLGAAYQGLGRLDESLAAYERAVALAPERPHFYRGLAESKRFTAGDPHLAAMEALAASIDSMDERGAMQLRFALGKALADVGRYEESMAHLIAGNARKRSTIEYREDATLAMFRRVEEVFSAELLQRMAGLGDPSDTPVFIVGMPRSGTTLTEQILASHPQVFGAGELNHIHATARGMRWVGGAFSFPDVAPSLSAARLRALGGDYVRTVRALAPQATRITDKLPENFLYVGLIRLMLPNARIIRLVRDPVDICLSCFSKLFGGEQEHTYDLAELGRYYRGFERLMRHWRAVIGEDVLLEVRYEDLVADFEPQARRIVAHCGLEWDARCLAFNRTERIVHTASAVQVRQPLYQTSVGRGRHYGVLLKPLLEALQDGTDST